MLTMLLAAAVIAEGPKLVCPVMGDEVAANAPHYEYAGLITGVCCSGCESGLKSNAEKTLSPRKSGLVGYSLYDVVSHEAVKPAGPYSDFGSVRYFFASKENKAKFDANPKDLSVRPKFEAYGKCIVTGEALPPTKAAAFRDVPTFVGGVKEIGRVYFCCTNCAAKFDADNAKYLPTAKFAKATIHEIKK